jgi:O-antigen ligase
MKQLVSNRWYSLASLLLVLTCGAVLYLKPQVGGWVILIILLPWMVRLTTGRLTFERTFFVIPLALFIMTAAIGVWAAYDQQAAWEKFWIIISAAALFAAVVSQPKANLGLVTGLVGILGVIIAIVYFFTNDWHDQATDLAVINRAGEWIMSVRPISGSLSLPPNFIGGVLAMLVPIPFSLAVYCWRKGEYVKTIISMSMVLVISIGLILTSSRGAWIALLIAIFGWILWRLSVSIADKINQPYWLIYCLLLVILVIPAILLIITSPGGFVGLVDLAPGLPSGDSRLELFQSTVKLIGDFPFTGGGLRSFAGLYSQYIMVTPYFLYSYGHNFYLDTILEQGFLGGFALFVLILGSIWYVVKQVLNDSSDYQVTIISEAVLVGVIVLLIHGLIDDPLYGDLGTPLLLFLPGLALMLVSIGKPMPDTINQSKESGASFKRSRSSLNKLILPGGLIALSMIAVIVFNKQLIASWYADLGAVEMSRQELTNWPLNRWVSSTDVSYLQQAQNLFAAALTHNQQERTALHRRGLIAMQNRNFRTAQTELERAYKVDSEHRGIQKSLGYAYAWGGDFDQSKRMLREIYEAENEMGVYSWWWGEQDRGDLAQQAKDMEGILHELKLKNQELGVD